MAANDIYVAPDGDRWKVGREGQKDLLGLFDTQSQAESLGREVARSEEVEFTVRGTDGQIRVKDSFGNDPRNVPG